jgi:hypothetical protein
MKIGNITIPGTPQTNTWQRVDPKIKRMMHPMLSKKQRNMVKRCPNGPGTQPEPLRIRGGGQDDTGWQKPTKTSPKGNSTQQLMGMHNPETLYNANNGMMPSIEENDKESSKKTSKKDEKKSEKKSGKKKSKKKSKKNTQDPYAITGEEVLDNNPQPNTNDNIEKSSKNQKATGTSKKKNSDNTNSTPQQKQQSDQQKTPKKATLTSYGFTQSPTNQQDEAKAPEIQRNPVPNEKEICAYYRLTRTYKSGELAQSLLNKVKRGQDITYNDTNTYTEHQRIQALQTVLLGVTKRLSPTIDYNDITNNTRYRSAANLIETINSTQKLNEFIKLTENKILDIAPELTSICPIHVTAAYKREKFQTITTSDDPELKKDEIITFLQLSYPHNSDRLIGMVNRANIPTINKLYSEPKSIQEMIEKCSVYTELEPPTPLDPEHLTTQPEHDPNLPEHIKNPNTIMKLNQSDYDPIPRDLIKWKPLRAELVNSTFEYNRKVFPEDYIRINNMVREAPNSDLISWAFQPGQYHRAISEFNKTFPMVDLNEPQAIKKNHDNRNPYIKNKPTTSNTNQTAPPKQTNNQTPIPPQHRNNNPSTSQQHNTPQYAPGLYPTPPNTSQQQPHIQRMAGGIPATNTHQNLRYRYGHGSHATNDEKIQTIALRFNHIEAGKPWENIYQLVRSLLNEMNQRARWVRHKVRLLPFSLDPRQEEASTPKQIATDEDLKSTYLNSITVNHSGKYQGVQAFIKIATTLDINMFTTVTDPTLAPLRRDFNKFLVNNNLFITPRYNENALVNKWKLACAVLHTSLAHDKEKHKEEFIKRAREEHGIEISERTVNFQCIDLAVPSYIVPLDPLPSIENRRARPIEERNEYIPDHTNILVIMALPNVLQKITRVAQLLQVSMDNIQHTMSYGCRYVDITDNAYNTQEEWIQNAIEPQRQWYKERTTVNVTGLPESPSWLYNVPQAELDDGSMNQLNVQQLLSGTTVIVVDESGKSLPPPYKKALKGKFPGTLVLEGLKRDEETIKHQTEIALISCLHKWVPNITHSNIKFNYPSPDLSRQQDAGYYGPQNDENTFPSTNPTNNMTAQPPNPTGYQSDTSYRSQSTHNRSKKRKADNQINQEEIKKLMIAAMAPLQEEIQQLRQAISPNNLAKLQQQTEKDGGYERYIIPQEYKEAITDTSFHQHLAINFPEQLSTLIQMHQSYRTTKVSTPPPNNQNHQSNSNNENEYNQEPANNEQRHSRDSNGNLGGETQTIGDIDPTLATNDLSEEHKPPDLHDARFITCPSCNLIFHHTDQWICDSHVSQCIEIPPNRNKEFASNEEATAAILNYQLINQQYIPHSVWWYMLPSHPQQSHEEPNEPESESENEDEDDAKDDNRENLPKDDDGGSTPSNSSSSSSSSSDSSSESGSSDEEEEQDKLDDTTIADTKTTQLTPLEQTKSYHIQTPVNFDNLVLYERAPPNTYAHMHIHNQYFDKEPVECNMPLVLTQQVQVDECEQVIKVLHQQALETNYPNEHPYDKFHYTIKDLAEFEMAELHEDRKRSNEADYNRQVKRGIRHSIPEDKWSEAMRTEERLDNEIEEIDNQHINDGQPIPPDHPTYISNDYIHYAFDQGNTFQPGQTACLYQSGTMHTVKIISSTETTHTFELGNRIITTTSKLHKPQYTHHKPTLIEPFEPTEPDYQDEHGWNQYEDFIKNGMCDDKPERDSPILYAEQSGQLTNLIPGRYVSQHDDGSHTIRTMANRLIANYTQGIYPHVQRFENRADSPYDSEIVDLRSSRYKDELAVTIPVVGQQYVHDDWNKESRKQLITIIAVSPREITFKRPGPLEQHTSTGPFHEPILKQFHQYDTRAAAYNTPHDEFQPGELIMSASHRHMQLYVTSGKYNGGWFVGSQKYVDAWQTGPIYAPIQRLYSDDILHSNDLDGITRIYKDERGVVVRDPDIYQLVGPDEIKDGCAAMIFEPQQNIMIPITITHRCIGGVTFTDEFNEEHFTSGDVFHPLTEEMRLTVSHRSRYRIPRNTPTTRQVNDVIMYDNNEQFLPQGTITHANHPTYDIFLTNTHERIPVNESEIHTPVKTTMREVLANKEEHMQIELIGTYINCSATQGHTKALRNLLIAIDPKTPDQFDGHDPFSSIKKRMIKDIDDFTTSIERLNSRNKTITSENATTATDNSSVSSSSTDPIPDNPINPSPKKAKIEHNPTPSSWEQRSATPPHPSQRRKVSSLVKGIPKHKPSIWDSPTPSHTSDESSDYITSPTTTTRLRNRIAHRSPLFSSDSSTSSRLYNSPRKTLFPKTTHTKPPTHPTTTPTTTLTRKQPITESPIKQTFTKITNIIKTNRKCKSDST